MPTAIVQPVNKQIKTVTGRKEKESVITSNNAAQERENMKNWIKRFDELFAALCKSESENVNTAENQKVNEFSTELKIDGFQPSDVELVVDTNGKLIVKGRREVKNNPDFDFEEFEEVIDLPDNIDDEEISLSQAENGNLVIKAPLLMTNQKDSSADSQKNNQLAVIKENKQRPNEWNQLMDELFYPVVRPVV
jgi:HSP20 family molecular chaperone IbpA